VQNGDARAVSFLNDTKPFRLFHDRQDKPANGTTSLQCDVDGGKKCHTRHSELDGEQLPFDVRFFIYSMCEAFACSYAPVLLLSYLTELERLFMVM